MDRRSLLATVVSTSLLGGCTDSVGSVFNGRSTVPRVIEKAVSSTARRCIDSGEREQTAEIRYEANAQQTTVSGTVSAYKPCLQLRVSVENGIGLRRPDDSMFVDVEPTVPADGVDCEPCPAEIDYELSLRFDRPPSELSVFHIERTGESEPSGTERVGPLAVHVIPNSD